MSIHIPPSLKWLIDKRARISGEINKTRKSLDRAHELINEMHDLEDTLSAIDKTLALHELQIDKTLIQPINSHYVRLKIPYGGINYGVLTCLKLYNEGSPVSKSTINSFIIAKYYNSDESGIPFKQIAISIHQALNRLHADGKIKRFHDPKLNGEGLWKLADMDD